MKRRIATLLLTSALSTSLILGGCGSSSNTETTNNDSGNSSGGFLSEVTNSKSEVLSEVLSTGKIIAYKVDSVDKAETPDTLYFFDNGKVTIIPGEEFELTMGDFAKMSDDEIWEKYQTVKDVCCENYITQEKDEWQNTIEELQEIVNGTSEEMLFNKRDVIMLAQEFADCMPKELESIWSGEEVSGEAIRNAYEEVVSIAQQNELFVILDMCEGYGIERAEEEAKVEIERLQSLIDSTDYELPFVELPYSFLVFTNSSGNNVESETMIHPEFSLSYGTRTYTYNKLNFVLGLTRQEQIYDTTYNCIALQGSGSFLTRETMDIDTLDSKNVLIDLSSSEINELFEDEVNEKYE